MKKNPKFHLFYGGPFSQWQSCAFIIDGIEYNCAEQYMMAQKAQLFRDFDILTRIMATEDPSTQKALGKKVKGFSKVVWESVARDVVMRASLAKFTSSLPLYHALMATKGQTLVEASPTDVIWGIGLSEYDADAFLPEKWRGHNWLGQVLTDLRLHLEEVRSFSLRALS